MTKIREKIHTKAIANVSREEHLLIGVKRDSLRCAPFMFKLLQNGAEFIQKLIPGFKSHIRNLENFRQAVESLKSLNSMDYF